MSHEHHDHAHEEPTKKKPHEDEECEKGVTESSADVEPGAPDEPPPHP